MCVCLLSFVFGFFPFCSLFFFNPLTSRPLCPSVSVSSPHFSFISASHHPLTDTRVQTIHLPSPPPSLSAAALLLLHSFALQFFYHFLALLILLLGRWFSCKTTVTHFRRVSFFFVLEQTFSLPGDHLNPLRLVKCTAAQKHYQRTCPTTKKFLFLLKKKVMKQVFVKEALVDFPLVFWRQQKL